MRKKLLYATFWGYIKFLACWSVNQYWLCRKIRTLTKLKAKTQLPVKMAFRGNCLSCYMQAVCKRKGQVD